MKLKYLSGAAAALMLTTANFAYAGEIMLSNNACDQITPSAEAAQKAGAKVVTWDSPIPSGKGEMAVLSATPDASNQNAWIESMKVALAADPKYAEIKLVDVVYGDDQAETSYNRALALVDKYPDLGLIMSPTTVGIQATAKAMQDEGLCEKVKTSGLGLPSEMVSCTLNGCAPQFALWDFRDLGYLTCMTAYGLATGQLKGEIGETFTAGRMGDFTIEADASRPGAKRILMGPFTVYTKDNVEAAAK